MKFLKKLITPKKALIFTIIVFAFLFITQGEPYYRSDEWCYYTISKSLIDKNSFVNNQRPEYFDYMEHVKETYNNNYISVCSPGVSIIQLPGLIIANIFKGNKTIYNDYFMAYDGTTLLEGMFALFTAMTFALLSLILIFKSLKLLGFSDINSILSTGAAFISSFAVWYVFLNPSFTHIYEVFGISAIIYCLVKLKKEPLRARPARNALHSSAGGLLLSMGFAVGLSFLIRPTLLPIGIVIGLFFLLRRNWRSLGYFVLGGIPLMLVWFAYNLVSYGGIIASGYSVVRTENFNFSVFNGFNVLFSQYRGWLVYSPIFIFAIIGLILLYRKNKLLSVAALVSIFSSVIIYGFWPSWWGGGSYGQRFMIFAVPLGAIGLAFLIKYLKDKSKTLRRVIFALMSIAFLFSLGLVGLYRVTITTKLEPPYAGKIDGMYSVERYTPLEIYKSNIDLIKSSTSIRDYLGALYKNVNGGSGLLAILTGTSNGVLRVDDRDSNLEKLIILTPPYLRRPLPEDVFGYFKATSGAIYTVELKGITTGDILEMDCSNGCVSKSDKMTVMELNYELHNLPVSDFVALDTSKGTFFFKYAPNLQFRGFPENVEIGAEEYNF